MSTTAVYLFAVLAVPVALVMTSVPAHAQWTGGNHASRPLPLTATADVETNANVVANNKSTARYNVVPIGVLPGKTVSFLTNSRSVNNLGHVTGYSYVYSATDPNNLFLTGQSFIWKNGKLTALPLLPGWQGAFGFSINDLDQVAGTAQMGTESNLSQTAVLWTHGEPTNLGALASGLNSAALDVNIFGVVAGVSNTASPSFFVPVAWYGGEIHPLPLLTGYTAGLASEINAEGVIAGFLQVSPSSSVDNALVCGIRTATATPHRLTSEPLGERTGEAFGINTLNQIVGYSYNSTNSEGPAFLWSSRGGIGALPPLAWRHIRHCIQHQ